MLQKLSISLLIAFFWIFKMADARSFSGFEPYWNSERKYSVDPVYSYQQPQGDWNPWNFYSQKR